MPTTIPLLTICSARENQSPFMAALKRAMSTPRTPAKTGLYLIKLHTQCSSEVEAFGVVRDKLVSELGTPVKDEPGRVRFEGESAERFAKEMDSLQRDVEVPTPAAKLPLPPEFTPEDWLPIIAALDIFEEA